MIDVSLIDDFGEMKQLWNEWGHLCQKIGSRLTVFSTPEWYECWWTHFKGSDLLHLLVVRENGVLLGIAPLKIQEKRFRGLPARILGFIENGNSLHNDFIILSGRETEVLESICTYLSNSSGAWDLIEFVNLPDESASYSALPHILRTLEFTWVENKGLNSPYIPLTSGWESYFSQRTARTRKTLRQICNRLDNAGKWQVKRVKSWDDYMHIRDAVYDVARRSWTEMENDSLSSATNKEFFEELSLNACNKGWLNLWTLELNGETIAFEYHLRYGDRVHGLRSSYAEEYASLSPGSFLNYHILQALFENDEELLEYDLGGSYDPYKKKWANEVRPHINFQMFKKSSYSSLLYWYEYGLISGLRRLRDRWKSSRLIGV